MNEKLKIGILGCRGIPNNYGGFEQCAEYLSHVLANKGHEVTVYNSSLHPYKLPKWKNVNIVSCKDPENKYGTFGQFIYDFNCIKDAKSRDFDITLHLGYTSSAIWFPFLDKKSHHVINMDGLEWKRNKYNSIVKRFLRFSEFLAMRFFDDHVADAMEIKEYLEHKYQKPLTYIPYGADVNCEASLGRFQYPKNEYDLVICRMEPENHVELIIQGHLKSKNTLPLIIIGNTTNDYGTYLKGKYEQSKVVFLEGIYNKGELESIRRGCRLYYHGHSVGGTNPSLLDAMASGCLICAHDNQFNREVLRDKHLYFKSEDDFVDLSRVQRSLFEEDIDDGQNRLHSLYNWDNIADMYEKFFYEKLGLKYERAAQPEVNEVLLDRQF
ncbi:MAG: DUF1972 domain-containing protein [Flavobacteriales bacterium]|nr:DUF1972 domain-containing protein [Flavobacteriales bacterium]